MANEVTIEDLQAFSADTALAKLEKDLSEFNLFEAIGAENKEVWHSDFLAFLLNPAQNHCLGDTFIKLFLQKAVPELSGIESWDGVQIRREYQHVDILIEQEQREICVIIENKIWSHEGEQQLVRYLNKMRAEHPGWSTYGIFLTPGGERPTHESYHPYSYSEIKTILNQILTDKSGQEEDDVDMVIRHYRDMLERYIVSNPDAKTLARLIYFKHAPAISLMKPEFWCKWIGRHLADLIRGAGDLKPEKPHKNYVRFRVGDWAEAKGLRAGSDINKATSYPLFYFTFYNFDAELTLYLWIGPSVVQQVHEQLLRLGEQNIPPFRTPGWEGDYRYIYKLKFLGRDDYKTLLDDDLKRLIGIKWRQFTDDDLPRIYEALAGKDWFWHAPDQSSQL